jgi:hypothetical protein
MHGLALTWALEPTHAKLFFEFLVIVCLITVVRAVTLALVLFRLPGRARVTLADVLAQRIDPDRLAKAALANAVSREGGADRRASDEVCQTLRMADATFQYRWSVSHARVIATNRLLRLTLLVSLAITCFGTYPAFRFAYNDTNRMAAWAWFIAGELLLVRLASGLAVCVLLAVVSMFLEGRLIHRQAAWRLFYATAMNALSRGTRVS